MIFAKVRRVIVAVAVAASLISAGRQAAAIDRFWIAPDGVAANYNLGSNWNSNFVPEAGGGNNERAVIGTTQATVNGVATLASTPVAAGGLVLGLEPTTTGSLAFTAGTLNEVTTAQAAVGADGRVFVGGGGRGYLTMSGTSTLNALGLTIGGENVTTGQGTSLVDLSGSAKVNITGSTGLTGLTTISRRLKITGPSVMFTTQRTLRFEGSSSYTAGITSPTSHSALVTSSNAIVSGTLNVEFSGAGATHSPGATWTLIDAVGNISGNFSNVPSGADVTVSGLASPPPLGSAYRIRKVPGPAAHTLMQLSLEKLLVLRVNRDTGELSIRNPQTGTISIDNYQITSPRGSLLSTYKGISGAPAGDVNWVKAGPTSTFLAEVKNDPANSNSVFNLTSVPSVTLGTGFSKTAVGASTANLGFDGEDLVFEYSAPNQETIRGQVEYIGTKFENDLVLRVNPNTGQAFLKNDSLVSLTLDAYSILSSTNNLNGGGWTGIGGAWQKSNPPTTAALTESNPTGSITLVPGAQQAIGTIGTFTTAPAQAGLSLQFLLAAGFGASPSDKDVDGDVDGNDFLLIQRGLGTTYTAADITDWKTNFGSAGGGAPETTFRTGSVVFDATAGLAAGSAVPEPASALLTLSAVAACFAIRRRPRQNSATQPRGGTHMSAHRQWMAALCGLGGMLLGATPAAAVTQGIPLVNNRFELPGPTGTKVLAFDAAGTPIPGIIPGWTFEGPGVETFGDMVPGDSGTEGGGNPGNELLLSTQDGVVYQTSAFNIVSVPATQQYRLSFDAHNIFTIDGECQLTARLYYLDGGVRTTIGSPLVASNLGGFVNYQITIPNTAPELQLGHPALGKPIGVEFDTTSTEANPLVLNSWAGVDNVILQISGTLAGDFNGDGLINLTDYGILRDNLQESHDFLAEGEITGEGFTNLNDFRAWKSLPQVVASGVLATIAVPEPGTMALAAIGAIAALQGARRRSLKRSASIKTSGLALVIAAAVVLGGASRSEATLLYYDPFDIGANPAAGQYTLGTLVGQNPTVGPTNFFSGPWVTGTGANPPAANVVVTPGISFLGAPAQGGAVQTGTAASRAGRLLTTPLDASTVGTYYLSFMVNFGNLPVGSVPAQSDFGHRAVEFWEAGGQVNVDGDLSMTIGYLGYNGNAGAANQISSTGRMRILLPGSDQVIENSPLSFNLDGATHLVVLKMQMTTDPVVSGVGGDTVSLYLDPTTAVEADLPPPGATGTGLDFSLGSMSASIYFGPGTGVMPILDEVRVADTWASVVPEFPTPGDTDGDHDVDLTDYNNIIANFGQSVSTALQGDVALHNGKQGSDGRVDIGDYRLWRDNRTDVPPADPTGAPVPEPSGLILAMGGAMALAARRRRALSASTK
jgi:hypothetical protein